MSMFYEIYSLEIKVISSFMNYYERKKTNYHDDKFLEKLSKKQNLVHRVFL